MTGDEARDCMRLIILVLTAFVMGVGASALLSIVDRLR